MFGADETAEMMNNYIDHEAFGFLQMCLQRNPPTSPHDATRSHTSSTRFCSAGNRGLVVEFSPATRETRVRFPAVAFEKNRREIVF